MQCIAIIPARGGSKGVYRKNMVDVCGIPLLVHSIRHALGSSIVDRVFVSSEDREILDTAKMYGAEIIIRPVELAGDTVLDLPVFQHCLNELSEKEKYFPDIIVHLRPTAPYRKVEWIEQAIRILINNPDADAIRSVSKPITHPYRIFRIDQNGYLDSIMKHECAEPYILIRQELPDMYYYNCVLDVTRYATIMNKKSMTGNKLLPFIIDKDFSLDIDTPQDLYYIRYFMENHDK